MKTIIKNSIKHFALISLLAAPLLFNNDCNALAPSQEIELKQLTEKFLDLKQETHATFASFADKYLAIISKDPRLVAFCEALKKAKINRSHKMFGLYLLQFRNQGLMPATLQEVLAKHKTNELERILQARMQR